MFCTYLWLTILTLFLPMFFKHSSEETVQGSNNFFFPGSVRVANDHCLFFSMLHLTKIKFCFHFYCFCSRSRHQYMSINQEHQHLDDCPVKLSYYGLEQFLVFDSLVIQHFLLVPPHLCEYGLTFYIYNLASGN